MYWCNIKFSVLLMVILEIKSTLEISNVEKIKPKNTSYEIRLISFRKKTTINSVKFVDFDDLKSIKFWDADIINRNYNNYSIIFSFVANRQVLLDRSFDVNDFTIFKSCQIVILFYFIKGIDLNLFNFHFSNKNTNF